MRQARAGHDTRGQRVTPRCRWAAGPGRASRRRAEPKARGAGGSRAGRHPPAHTATRHHWYGGRRRVRRARAGFETTHRDTHQHASRGRCGGHRRDRRAWLRCPWAAAGPGRHHTAPKAPPAWRAPEGPEGTGGLRDRPLRAAGSRVAISRAAGPDGARNTRGATSNTSRKAAAHGHTKQPGPAGRAKRPARQHTTRRHKKHGTGARAHRPAPLDATTQTRQLRSTDVPCRSARAARQWRRSSRSLRLRRRAGPRR